MSRRQSLIRYGLLLLLGGCKCSTGDAPDHYGDYCDSGMADECPSGMVCARLNLHTSNHNEVISALYACAIPCETACDCPVQTCGGGTEYSNGDPYRCADDGFCFVEWCADPEHI